MWKRNSLVQNIQVKSIEFSSILEIGDSVQSMATSNVIAVQKEGEYFWDNEVNFQQLPLFFEPIPIPISSLPEPVIKRYQESSNIHVHNIDIKGMSASSIVQIGNTNNAYLESRVFHMRRLSEDKNEK